MGALEDDGTVPTTPTPSTKGDRLGIVGVFTANRTASISIITAVSSLISPLPPTSINNSSKS